MLKRMIVLILALAFVCLFTGPTMAGDFPSKSIVYHIPCKPGGQSNLLLSFPNFAENGSKWMVPIFSNNGSGFINSPSPNLKL